MARPRLHVLPWDRPLLPQAVTWLATNWNGAAPLDLSDHLVIVPTRQAGRRLREALAAHAAEHQQAVFSPRVLTPEAWLHEATDAPDSATPLETMLAWMDVLRAIDLAEFDEVFPVAPPARNFAWASRLAREFLHLQQTLAENDLRMADVPRRGSRGGGFPEYARWTQLAALEARYDTTLARRGRRDPEAARIAATESTRPPEGISRLVVLATPDPQPALVTLATSYANTIPVDIVVFGPGEAETAAGLFDEWGRPQPNAWSTREWSPPEFAHRVHLCADPAAQAERIVAATASTPPTAGWTAIGVADAEIFAPLHHGFGRAGLTAYDPEGTPRRAEPLHHLLTLLLAFAREPTFDTVAALARCPDVLAWLRQAIGPSFVSSEFLRGLDELHARHLPGTLATARDHAAALTRDFPGLAPSLAGLAQLRATLVDGEFPDNVRGALATIFAARAFDFDSRDDARALDAATTWLQTMRDTAEATRAFPGLSMLDAWALALETFGEGRRFEDKPAAAIELQGWLELLWEDSPHLIVAGMNDGCVPTAITGDPFLPEALRETLGLRHNAARLARDAYLLEALVTSRAGAGRVDLLFGRTSAVGDPLRPSRLLLRCAESDLPERVAYLFRDAPGEHEPVPWRRAWQLTPPVASAITRLSVTAFRDYLACPFRFQLRHALHMQPVDPFKAELDPRDFGTLCHHALESIGLDATMRMSTDPAALREFLLRRLERAARDRYGEDVALPLRVQLESARQRLTRAAEIQALHRREGWVIERVEWKFELALHGLTVVGKIDRIDRHEDTGAVRVLDYKTSDKPVHPRAAHVRRPQRNEDVTALPAWAKFTLGEDELRWIDLQLPLYRRALAAEFGDDIVCGYFNLPKASTETAIAWWDDYDGDWQAAAGQCVDGIAAAVAARRFWPPAELDARDDEFASLFQHGTADSVAPREQA